MMTFTYKHYENAMNKLSNDPPDVVLNLTHEQATFMLKNMLANHRLCTKLILGLADLDMPIDQKPAKAAPISAMQDRFTEIMRLLRAAGAKEPDEDE